MGRLPLALICASLALAAGPAVAAAQDADDADKKDLVYSKKKQAYQPKEGEYGGVTPGVIYPYDDKDYKKRKRRPGPRKRARKNRIYWVGFQPKSDGTSRVFLQLSSEVEYSQAVVGNKLEVLVTGGRIRNSNGRRRLDARFFDTAVAEIKAKYVSRRGARKGKPARKSGVLVTVAFKNPADAREATASLSKEQDGFHYLFLDFGPPTKLPDKGDGD